MMIEWGLANSQPFLLLYFCAMKTCGKCKTEKQLDEFYKNKKRKDELRFECKSCSKASATEHRKTHRDTFLSFKKRYYNKNRDSILSVRKEYREKHKESIALYKNEYAKKRRKNDSVYRMIYNVRSRTSFFCKSIKLGKNFSTIESIGLDRNEFKKYIESLFTDGMTWNNYGEWHIDHIKPLCSAKTVDDVIKLTHYTNLQPLWWIDNLSKGGKYQEL